MIGIIGAGQIGTSLALVIAEIIARRTTLDPLLHT